MLPEDHAATGRDLMAGESILVVSDALTVWYGIRLLEPGRVELPVVGGKVLTSPFELVKALQEIRTTAVHLHCRA